MPNTIFSPNTASRISTATKWVEQQYANPVLDRWGRRNTLPSTPTLAVAQEDIAYGATGTVAIAEGVPLSEVAGSIEREVYNTLRVTVWDGSICVIAPPRVEQSGTEAHWHIVEAYSAESIRGTAQSSVSGGTTFTLENLSLMDGHFPDATLSAYMLPGYSCQAGQPLIVDWNEDTQQWETVGCCDEMAAVTCYYCQNYLAPSYFDVTFSGIADAICTDCDDPIIGLNQTFRVTHESLISIPFPTTACEWWAEINDTCALNHNNEVLVAIDTVGGNTRIRVTLFIRRSDGSGSVIVYEYVGTGIEDCLNLNNMSIPWANDSIAARCDGSSSTCHITAA